jgi:hypothetical protein
VLAEAPRPAGLELVAEPPPSGRKSGDADHDGYGGDEDAVGAEPPPSVPPPMLLPLESVRPSRPPSFPALPELESFRPTIIHRIEAWGRQYFLNSRFSFVRALGPMMAVALVLFTRWPGTNYIFDEQEALLANPYVNGTNGLKFWDAIHRDFWGLAPDRSVGSYRPIPNFLWRLLWPISHAPVFHEIYNVLLHGVNAALFAWIVFAWTKRRGLAYLTGFVFVTCAVLTEAVCGLVGIADVLGGLGALLALAALSLPGWAMPFAVFASVVFGLFSKESALVCVPLIPLAALVAAPLTHPERPARAIRAALALVASAAAFVLYVELRKKWFDSPLPSDLKEALPANATLAKKWMHGFLVWFHQAPLPKDPLNNPLAEADFPHRVAGALRVYWRGLLQMIAPLRLSGDYSFPQEPIPEDLYFRESIAGGAMMVLPLIGTVVLWIVAMLREARARRLAREGLADRLDAIARESDPDATFDGYGDADASAAGLSAFDRVRLGLGAALALSGIALAVADLLVLRKSYGGVPLALAGAPLFLLGVGFAVEGWRPLPLPDPKGSPLPLARVAPIFVAIGLTWVVVSFFPHSNIPVVLPTVRAERFWYFPAIGTSLIFAVLLAWFHETWRKKRVLWIGPVVAGLFLGLHAVAAYRHAHDYWSDVDFWYATKEAVPNSAKAHLNYSVMKGARGDYPTRLTESKVALALAPKWPMAHIYTGDTLCRMHKPDDAWPFYKSGFEVGPNELSLVALALQCLFDEKKLKLHEDELRDIAARHEGSWIAYLAIDTLQNGEKNRGVAPKYRPRGYNEGPRTGKEEDDDDDDDAPSATASASGSASASASAEETAEPSASETSDDAAPSATEDAKSAAKIIKGKPTAVNRRR